MIRTATRDDTDALLEIADASGLFSPDELVEVQGMLAAFVEGELEDEHAWVTDDDGGLTAVAYYAPEPFTDGVWNLYLLAVHPNHQSGGRGGRLVQHVEDAVAEQGARILLIETSGLDEFERTRAFYRRLNYTEEARIRDYYGPGDDKVVFWKSFDDHA